jgi:inner membrane protein
MRAAAHAVIAGASAFGTVTVIKHYHPAARVPNPAFAGVVAALAAGIPDYLEPATNPHHRQFCHSAAFATLLAAGMKRLYEWVPATPGEALLRDVLLSIGFGYLAHLGADATTAMGLPLIGKLS